MTTKSIIAFCFNCHHLFTPTSSQNHFNFFIHEPLAFDASWRVKFEYGKNKMTWHKEMLHYWNRVYYCGLDYHNNHFYSVSFSFNAHGAVFSQTSHHKEVRVTVMAKVKGTPTHVLMFQDWFSFNYLHIHTHKYK